MEAQNTIINDIIADARAKKASDIHISEGMPIWYRVNGKLRPAEWKMTPEEVRRMLEQMMDQWHRELFEAGHDADFAMENTGWKQTACKYFSAAEEDGSYHPSAEHEDSVLGRTEDADYSL